VMGFNYLLNVEVYGCFKEGLESFVLQSLLSLLMGSDVDHGESFRNRRSEF
jgi:hypothetical protein